MKASKIIENFLIILVFIAVIMFPWTAMYLGVENNLSGAEEKVKLSFENLDDYIIQNFPGREFLVRTINQIKYSIFDVSPNSSITKIGNTLLATETLNYYYHGLHDVTESDVDELVNKFKKFNTICERMDKKMVIAVTPSKPRFYDGVLPFADDVILAYQGKKNENPYEMLNRKLLETNLNYFDSIKYINDNKELMFGGKVPLFYNGAHHWSNYKGNLVGLAFTKFMKDKMHIRVPDLIVTASPSETAIYPDADLFNVLNIYDDPKEDFYSSEVTFENYDNGEDNFIIQGGSFLGGFLLPFTTIGLRNKVLHIENKACLTDHYKETIEFEDFDDLNSKINLLDELKEYNVFIFEINELNVYNATFGFIDYLLKNEEYMY